jgi:enoyl-[acyl-carrier protein] reductase I
VIYCTGNVLDTNYVSISRSPHCHNNNSLTNQARASEDHRSPLFLASSNAEIIIINSMSRRKVALVLGVANQRSIAWACAKSLLEADFDCILTYQSERFQSQISKLISNHNNTNSNILASFPCDVAKDEIPRLFENVSQILTQGKTLNGSGGEAPADRTAPRKIDAIVHSIAYANFEQTSFGQASWSAFCRAQQVSAYSLLELARVAYPLMAESSSITALSYLGAVRAVPNYHIMGPAKASLEAIVRGLALEYGGGERGLLLQKTQEGTTASTDNQNHHGPIIRVNAVSAAPLNTMSAKGIPGFSQLYEHAARQSPLGRHVTAKEVGDTVRFLATDGTGITGQTIYVDGGYSVVI